MLASNVDLRFDLMPSYESAPAKSSCAGAKYKLSRPLEIKMIVAELFYYRHSLNHILHIHYSQVYFLIVLFPLQHSISHGSVAVSFVVLSILQLKASIIRFEERINLDI